MPKPSHTTPSSNGWTPGMATMATDRIGTGPACPKIGRKSTYVDNKSLVSRTRRADSYCHDRNHRVRDLLRGAERGSPDGLDGRLQGPRLRDGTGHSTRRRRQVARTSAGSLGGRLRP